MPGVGNSWIGTYLAVVGNGLLVMEEGEAERLGLPIGEGKNLLARSWLEASLACVVGEHFLLGFVILEDRITDVLSL